MSVIFATSGPLERVLEALPEPMWHAALTRLTLTETGSLADGMVDTLERMGAPRDVAHHFAGEVMRLILH